MSLYKPSPIFEEIWENIRLLLEWQQGFGFYLVFSDNTYASLELKQRINDYLHIQSKRMQWFRPEQPIDVPQQVLQTLLDKDYQDVPVWIELTLSPQEQLWTAARQQTLSLLNRQRGLLEAQCLRAVFLLLPSEMAKDIVVYAPDLWSIRQYLAVLPSLEKQEELVFPLHQELVTEAEQADLAVLQGEWQKALALSRSHVEQLRLALNKQPEHPQITFNLWIALIRLGNLEQKLQRYEIAFDYYKESLDIASDIYNKNPMSNQSYFSYISSLNNLADLSYEVHNYKQALDLYENSLVLVKDWLKMSVNKQEPLNRLSFILLGIARIYNSQGDFSMSWQYATELLNAILSLQKNIDNYEIERRLSMAYQLLGDIKINLGDMDSGLNYYQKSLYITESIFDGDINNPKNIRDMMIILSKIAKVFDVLKSYEKVEKYYQQAIMLASKQCELIGSTPKALGDKFIINRNLLEFKLKIKYIDGSINLSDDIIKTALQLYNLSSKSLQAIEDLLEAYQLRLALEKQLNPNIEPLELLQKIADLEQQRQQLLNNP